MALILSIETATQVCSVALHDQGKLIGCQNLYVAKSHAESLLPMVEYLFKLSPYTKEDLAAIAISEGPGSYTGLRIGTATAKGLCYALEIPLIAVNTLEAMAWEMQPLNYTKALLCPMIDARRMEVYCLVMDNTGHVLEETQPCVIDSGSFQAWLTQNTILFFGDGAAKCRPILEVHKNAIFWDHIYPSAQYIGSLAYSRFQQASFVSLAAFEPLYLKPFQGNPQLPTQTLV
jgi:tRNA threonylcarbamoyladenosine biosynthesis protein TsaB